MNKQTIRIKANDQHGQYDFLEFSPAYCYFATGNSGAHKGHASSELLSIQVSSKKEIIKQAEVLELNGFKRISSFDDFNNGNWPRFTIDLSNSDFDFVTLIDDEALLVFEEHSIILSKETYESIAGGEDEDEEDS